VSFVLSEFSAVAIGKVWVGEAADVGYVLAKAKGCWSELYTEVHAIGIREDDR
jgi:hypothetical protein